MNARETLHEEVLERLNRTVIDAADFFASADESMSDGRQTAHGILSQLVFWHKQYVDIAAALLRGDAPKLKAGAFDKFNQIARNSYAGYSMTMLAYDLSCLQKEFDALVRQLPDWSINFPIKSDSEPRSLSERLAEIDQHIRQHVVRLQRGQ